MRILIYGMILLGAALMVRNIIRYARFARQVRRKGEWDRERTILYIPLGLQVGFLFGYLGVPLLGTPTLLVAAILFFGSVFVAIVVEMLQRVTDRIQANGELEARLLAAEESSRARMSFLSNMSHELRTPLNAILGVDAIALRDPELPPRAREQFGKIDESARHLLSLLNDILDVSRSDSGQTELKAELFSLPELLDQLSTITRARCEMKGLHFDFHGDFAEGDSYVGDRAKLRQALHNILDNAVKFTAAPGSVRFTAEKSAAYEERQTLRFTVADTGIGIDRAFLPHVFEPFAQEDASSTTRYGGSGLGLSIAKGIADMMNGEIRIDSEKGVGTTVTLIVTLKPAGEAERAQKLPTAVEERAQELPTAVEERPLAGLHVLIAEDVPLNAELLADLLALEEVGSDWVENGRLAVDTFAAAPPGTYDAILMDMRMPVMDGLAATRAIRALPREDAKRIPILAVTANALEEDVQRALQAGMNAHLAKPMDADRLYAMLRQLCPERPADPEGEK